jgi:hypothetical protein
MPLSSYLVTFYINSTKSADSIDFYSNVGSCGIYDQNGTLITLIGKWDLYDISDISPIDCGYSYGIQRRATIKISIKYNGTETIPYGGYMAPVSNTAVVGWIQYKDNSNFDQSYDYSSMLSLNLGSDINSAIDYQYVDLSILNNTETKLCEGKLGPGDTNAIQDIYGHWIDAFSGIWPCGTVICSIATPTITLTSTITSTITLTPTLTVTPTITPGGVIWSSNTHKIINTVISSSTGTGIVTWRQDFPWDAKKYNVQIQAQQMPNNAKITFYKLDNAVIISIIDDNGNTVDCSETNAILDVFIDYDIKQYGF